MPQDQQDFLNALADLKEEASKRYKKAVEEAKKEQEQNAVTPESFKADKLYKKSEITKCRENLELHKVYVSGYGVKNRCRKEDYFNICVGYYIRGAEGAPSVPEKVEQSKELASELLGKNFRSVKTAHLAIKNSTYNAPVGDSLFHGFTEMLSIGQRDVGIKLI